MPFACQPLCFRQGSSWTEARWEGPGRRAKDTWLCLEGSLGWTSGLREPPKQAV